MGAVRMVSLDEIIGYRTTEGYSWCEKHMTSRCSAMCTTRYANCVAETFPSKRRDEQYADLLESMRINGFRGAVCVDNERGWRTADDPTDTRPRLANGHHRIAAAAELGITEIPIVDQWAESDDPSLWPDNSDRNPKRAQELWEQRRREEQEAEDARIAARKAARAKAREGEPYLAENTYDARDYYLETGLIPDGYRKCSCCTVMYYL